MGTDEDTVRSYETSAAEYAAEAATMPEWVAGEIDAFVDALGGTGRILEIGSGGGRDAREFERVTQHRYEPQPRGVEFARDLGRRTEFLAGA